ncbi:MAG: translation elongation factor Ts [Gammaproteobacteria bacterium]|nr:translation elongation factor Ts [Gammaproteobacteria bacterium]
MAISAAQVKELRERTGLGMMECKAALIETDGNMEAAIDVLRKKAGAKVEKKAHRIAAEGAIGLYVSEAGDVGALVEINSETDFVAKEDRFVGFAQMLAELVARQNPAHIEALMALPATGGGTVSEQRAGLIAQFGENMGVRRFVRMTADGGRLGHYLHGRKIGVLIRITGGDATLARDLAMHIAASRPQYVQPGDVPADVMEREKAIYVAQAEESGKPREIIEKMVMGKVKKYLDDISLVGQPFVKDPEITVAEQLKRAKAAAHAFHRLEVGEGIEREASNFASEVMSQVQGT